MTHSNTKAKMLSELKSSARQEQVLRRSRDNSSNALIAGALTPWNRPFGSTKPMPRTVDVQQQYELQVRSPS
jgi:hypothetical protein